MLLPSQPGKVGTYLRTTGCALNADRPIVEIGLVGESLLRLAVATGEPHFCAQAERTLALFANAHERAASFAATYARAATVSRAYGKRPRHGRARRGIGVPRSGTTLCAAPMRDAAELRAAYDGGFADIDGAIPNVLEIGRRSML
jgi:hypothetical protein